MCGFRSRHGFFKYPNDCVSPCHQTVVEDGIRAISIGSLLCPSKTFPA
jgi:hypothetical protein